MCLKVHLMVDERFLRTACEYTVLEDVGIVADDSLGGTWTESLLLCWNLSGLTRRKKRMMKRKKKRRRLMRLRRMMSRVWVMRFAYHFHEWRIG